MVINTTKTCRRPEKPIQKLWSKVISMAAMAGAILSSTGFPGRACAQAADTPAKSKQESPFACNAFALSPEERNRHFDELSPALRALKKSVRELEDGYAFEFPANAATLQLLTEWTIQERICCPFLDITLHLEREGGPLWVYLSGRKGTKEFLRIDVAKWIRQ
jgi:hypothetical protein